MNKIVLAVAAGLVLSAAGAASAASPFDGTWKTDLSQVKPSPRPMVMALKDGVFDCKSCVPPYSVKADGAFHPVKDHPGMDESAVKVVDARTVEETQRLKGRVVSVSKVTASPDGKTLKVAFTDTTNAGAPAVTGEGSATRLEPGPAGAHMLSGSWRQEAASNVSDAGLKITFAMKGDVLEMNTPTGQSYAAKVGGPSSPIKGDPSVDTVTVKKVSDHEMIETDSFNGKAIAVYDMVISADGKTMSVAVENKKVGTKSAYKALKL